MGETEMLVLGDCCVIPLNRVKRFDFTVATGNSVQIVTDDSDEEIIFAYENCEAIKLFLKYCSVRTKFHETCT